MKRKRFYTRSFMLDEKLMCIIHPYVITIWNINGHYILHPKTIIKTENLLSALKIYLTREEYFTLERQIFEKL